MNTCYDINVVLRPRSVGATLPQPTRAFAETLFGLSLPEVVDDCDGYDIYQGPDDVHIFGRLFEVYLMNDLALLDYFAIIREQANTLGLQDYTIEFTGTVTTEQEFTKCII